MTEITQALVVDDSKSARYSLKKMLTKQGVDILFAESAGAALNLLETEKPDVIFMDHLMPGMDGFEATKAIKANPLTTTIPIIMCTSREGADYEGEAKMNGASAILPKPAPEEILTQILTDLSEPKAPIELTTPAKKAPGADHHKTLEELTETLRPALETKLQDALNNQIAAASESLNSSLETRLTQKVGQLFEEQQEEQNRIHEANSAKLQRQLLGSLNNEMDGKIKFAVRQQLAERKSDEEVIEHISHQLKAELKQQLGEELTSALAQQERSFAQIVARAQMVGATGTAVGVAALVAALFL